MLLKGKKKQLSDSVCEQDALGGPWCSLDHYLEAMASSLRAVALAVLLTSKAA